MGLATGLYRSMITAMTNDKCGPSVCLCSSVSNTLQSYVKAFVITTKRTDSNHPEGKTAPPSEITAYIIYFFLCVVFRLNVEFTASLFVLSIHCFSPMLEKKNVISGKTTLLINFTIKAR